MLKFAVLALSASLLFAEVTTFPRSSVRVVNAIDFGEQTQPFAYRGSPKYIAYSFNGQAGYRVEVTVIASKGEPVAYIADSHFRVLGGGADHFTFTIPEGTPPDTYYVVCHEKSFRPAQLTVDLEKP